MGVPMSNSIKTQVNILVKLQTIDNEKRSLQSTLDSVDGRIEAIERPLKEHEQALQQKKEKLEGLRKNYRDREREAQTQRHQIEKSREKARSVKTNKEYQSILKEIDELKTKISNIEDEMLENLEEIESIEIEVDNDKNELKLIQSDIRQEIKAIEDETAVTQEKLNILLKNREAVLEGLSPLVLTYFEKVRAKVGLLTVAAAKDAICQGCHVNIPPQLYNELQRYEQLVQCPNCQRIIYFFEK
jgi:predicted  nucleic acid-binding Zn-ribbon protein